MEDIAYRLVMIRRLFADAIASIDRNDGPSRMQAVMLCDLAVETAAKTFKKLQKELEKTPEQLSSILKMLDFDDDSVEAGKNIRKLRNGVVHEGLEPTIAETQDILRKGLELLVQMFTKFGFDYENFSVVQWVRNPLVRPEFDAAIKLQNEDPVTALRHLEAAMYRLDGLAQEIAGAAADLDLWMYEAPLWEDAGIEYVCADGRHSYMKFILKAVASGALTADTITLARLRLILREVSVETKKAGNTSEKKDKSEHHTPIDTETVQWALEQIALIAYSLEKRFPDLEAPIFVPRKSHRHQDLLPIRVKTWRRDWRNEAKPSAEDPQRPETSNS